MTRKKTITYIVITLVVLALAWWFFIHKKEEPVKLETEKAEIGYISESVTATGKIQPVDTVQVGTQVSGTIARIYTDFNATVKKGQLLAELDKLLLQAAVDQIKANLTQSESNLTYQAGNFNRQKQLFETGSISRADYEIAQNTFNAAKANVNSVKAQLRSAQRNLSFTEIYSPIDGVVLNKNVNIGQTVAASFSTPTLFTLAKDITKMQVQANVDEADIGNIREGLRASFTVDAFLEDEFSGTVREIRLRPSVSSNVVTYTTLIDAQNDDKKLKPGMTANIAIYTKEVDSALLIPARAIKFHPDSSLSKQYTLVPDTSMSRKGKKGMGAGAGRPGGKTRGKSSGSDGDRASVWVLQGEKLVQKKIRTGLNDNTKIEVLEGLSATDIVVTGSTAPAGKKTQQGQASSPFMPQRRGR
ncbi:efflux RND transporter periplasmic adaptor subunit [Hufsiella ginkgonis]|uniref:Efflux RND transporter periplasmic adaptor subunit n=1 Tax=Hufsiella ginkgonis TaxID=2695274 RepID=A0A7K1XWN5_9SPHI|nr:efflux RND transporter periplasmic adaptor subunit [Hufsiella ginkgonis]MXV15227.1 efflux RND transporter periplasmic adaptor subunit [Hufsiella ginkgonis]